MREVSRLSAFLVAGSLALLLALVGCVGSEGVGVVKGEPRLRVATTTSLYDTGLWNVLEEEFEKQYDMRLDIVYAGTGIAIEYGERGDVDALAVHDKAREEKFISEGYASERIPFAYNYFVIAGPAADPAGIAGFTPEEAFKKLYDGKSAPFVSRGDDSGTHSKEKAIWKSAGLDYAMVVASGDWYVEKGGGMGPTLLMAGEKQGYALADVGTFLAYRGDTGLVAVVDKGNIMLNVYSMLAINPEKTSQARYEMAAALVDFMVSAETQELIGQYGVKDYGAALFTPCAGNEPIS